MTLKAPNLDDRRFDEIVEDARERIIQQCPEWTDLSPGDPGSTMLEAFAYLTDIMLYRLNLVPNKNYINFLSLIGTKLITPASASVMLQFSVDPVRSNATTIPKGTRVTTSRSDSGSKPPVFVTTEKVTIDSGETQVNVLARHGELIDAELLGTATGAPGLYMSLKRAPVISATGDDLDLVIGVEENKNELETSTPVVTYKNKIFRIWREVENFSNLDTDRFVYIADRLTGTINFAPAIYTKINNNELSDTAEALAEIPAKDREIRAWYCRGGGASGNVMANLLTVLKDAIPGVEVINLRPATGGRNTETLDNALTRGPQELHSLHRAVTARDFQLLAKRSSGAVNRAHAFTKAKLWSHADPGTVGVLLVPYIPEEQRQQGLISLETLQAYQTTDALHQIQKALDKRKPLGTTCVVDWARIKQVHVSFNLIVYREEKPEEVKQRVLHRLWKIINPINVAPDAKGWPFGKSLSTWDIFKIVGEESGVKTLTKVRLIVNESPDKNVTDLSADSFQEKTWYAVSNDSVFRSTNDAQGWESVGKFPGEKLILVKAFPKQATATGQPGLVALASNIEKSNSESALHISHDCGETWQVGLRTTFHVVDLAWVERNGIAVLLLATEKGLYELAINEDAVPHQILVDATKPTMGFYSVAVSTDVLGGTSVAVASDDDKGVYLSNDAGKNETFDNIGLSNKLIRVIAFQHYGANRYLWAGSAAIGNDPGNAGYRFRLTGAEKNIEGWLNFKTGWDAGGCRDFAFQGSKVFAASLRTGVLRLDINDEQPEWQSPDIKCGLPLRGRERLFQPTDAVVTSPNADLLLVSGIEGVYRSANLGDDYELTSSKEFLENVTLPNTWLFCSDQHDITVINEDEV